MCLRDTALRNGLNSMADWVKTSVYYQLHEHTEPFQGTTFSLMVLPKEKRSVLAGMEELTGNV